MGLNNRGIFLLENEVCAHKITCLSPPTLRITRRCLSILSAISAGLGITVPVHDFFLSKDTGPEGLADDGSATHPSRGVTPEESMGLTVLVFPLLSEDLRGLAATSVTFSAGVPSFSFYQQNLVLSIGINTVSYLPEKAYPHVHCTVINDALLS